MLRRSLIVLLAAIFAAAVPTAALATTPPDPTPAETSPPATEAPPQPDPTSPDTPTTTVPGDDGDDSDGNLLSIVLIVGGVVVLLVVLGAVLGRSKRPAPASAPRSQTPRAPNVPSPQASLLDTAQWVHDQLSLELMAASPINARQRWSIERSRLDNVAIGAQQQFTAGNDPNWQPFGQTVSSLAVALDTNLELRAQDPPNAQLVAESTDVVNRQRAVLQQLIYVLRQTTHR